MAIQTPNKEQMELFKRVYTKHISYMGMEKRKQLGNVENVVWDTEEKCLKVYFENGDWWHYTTSEEWY